MTPEAFDALCKLSRLALSDTEKARLRGQMETILGYVEKIGELDVSKVEPMGHASGLANAPRADEPRPGLPVDEALAQAPKRTWSFFSVPQVMED